MAKKPTDSSGKKKGPAPKADRPLGEDGKPLTGGALRSYNAQKNKEAKAKARADARAASAQEKRIAGRDEKARAMDAEIKADTRGVEPTLTKGQINARKRAAQRQGLVPENPVTLGADTGVIGPDIVDESRRRGVSPEAAASIASTSVVQDYLIRKLMRPDSLGAKESKHTVSGPPQRNKWYPQVAGPATTTPLEKFDEASPKTQDALRRMQMGGLRRQAETGEGTVNVDTSTFTPDMLRESVVLGQQYLHKVAANKAAAQAQGDLLALRNARASEWETGKVDIDTSTWNESMRREFAGDALPGLLGAMGLGSPEPVKPAAPARAPRKPAAASSDEPKTAVPSKPMRAVDTAIGTGQNADPDFLRRAGEELEKHKQRMAARVISAEPVASPVAGKSQAPASTPPVNHAHERAKVWSGLMRAGVGANGGKYTQEMWDTANSIARGPNVAPNPLPRRAPTQSTPEGAQQADALQKAYFSGQFRMFG